MKRIIIVIAVALGLGAIGLTAAHAANSGPSTWCTNGEGSSETDVPNPYVALSAEHWEDWNGWEIYTVCWSTTPTGSSAPEAAGGNFQASHKDNGPDESTARLGCHGDRTAQTMATVDCETIVSTTDDNNPSTAGRSASGSFSLGVAGPFGLGRTGAEVNPATGVNLPGDGNSISAASLGTGTGTCTYVDGTPNCPFNITVLGVTVNEADLVPAFTPDEPEPPCTGIDNTCVPLGGTVRVFQDTANPTLFVDTPVLTQPVDLDPDGTCVQVNATC